MTSKISGIFAPITTPFVNDEPALDQLKTNMRKYRETGLAGSLPWAATGKAKA